MNIELYSIRTTQEIMDSVDNDAKIISDKLSKRNINMLLCTQLDSASKTLLDALINSFSNESDIDTVVIANSFDDGKIEDNIIFKTLCGLCANVETFENKYLRDNLEDVTRNVLDMDDEVFMADTKTIGDDKKENETTQENEAFANLRIIEKLSGNVNGYCFYYENKKIIMLPNSALSSSFVEMVEKSVDFVRDNAPIPKKSLKKHGYKFIYNEKVEVKKRGFFTNLLPSSKDNYKEIIRKSIFLTATLTFIVTAVILINFLVVEPYKVDSGVDDLKDLSVTTEPIEVTDPVTKEVIAVITRDWDALQEVNDDIVGWIQLEDTKIDYPVLQSPNDTIDYQEYLYADYEKNYTGYGSIFVDFRSDEGMESKNVIMHGHNMLDGRMFQALMGYGTLNANLDYYKDNSVIKLDTPQGDGYYQIISVYKTNVHDEHGQYFDYLTGSFTSDAEFMNYVHLVRERSLFDIPVTVNEDDQLITLSTCSYEFDEFRTVVVARKVRPNEEPTVNVDEATVNNNALWPDVYYETYGYNKPEVVTFSNALENGDIDWYDGEGNLEGVERMFTLYDIVNDDGEKETPDDIITQGDEVLPDKVTLSESSVTLAVGEQITLKTSFEPKETTNKSLTWSTSDAKVLRISAGGVITGLAPGEAILTVTSKNGEKDSCKFVVTQEATRVSLNWISYNVEDGNSFQLEAILSPSNTSEDKITWKSSNTSVARVDSNGKVTAVAKGSATITATTENGLTASCKVTVYASSVTVPTNPPATNPPATDPPATDPEETDPPTTEPEETTPPTTAPEETDPPATEPEETNPPATDPPATEPEETT